jgi:hypothetical protein
MRTFVIFGAVLLAAVIVLAVSQRLKWARDRDAQCETARPLIAAGAPRDQVVDTIGSAAEFTLADWSEIERQFGGHAKAMTDIRQRLQERGRVIVYGQSNSIMFVYFNSEGRASHASCFLQ